MRRINYLKDLIENIDRILLILPAIFAVISIVMIESTVYDGELVLSRDVIIQFVAYIIGFVAMFVMLLFDYHQYMSITKILYVLSVIFMLLVYTPLGIEQYGSRAWISLGVTTFQPCEIVEIHFCADLRKISVGALMGTSEIQGTGQGCHHSGSSDPAGARGRYGKRSGHHFHDDHHDLCSRRQRKDLLGLRRCRMRFSACGIHADGGSSESRV